MTPRCTSPGLRPTPRALHFLLGIRTPWTLSSDGVWRATHRLGGRLFVAAGLVVAAAVLAAALVPAVDSYAVWRREQSGRPL